MNNVRAKLHVCVWWWWGAFFCLSLFVLVPISYCLNDCNFVILLKEVFPFCSSFSSVLTIFGFLNSM